MSWIEWSEYGRFLALLKCDYVDSNGWHSHLLVGEEALVEGLRLLVQVVQLHKNNTDNR